MMVDRGFLLVVLDSLVFSLLCSCVFVIPSVHCRGVFSIQTAAAGGHMLSVYALSAGGHMAKHS